MEMTMEDIALEVGTLYLENRALRREVTRLTSAAKEAEDARNIGEHNPEQEGK